MTTKWLVMNDLHLGVLRSGGTTPSSALALRQYVQDRYRGLLAPGTNVIVNGDFFDTYQVPMTDLLMAYMTTSEWLSTKGQELVLLPGNHDLSKNSANMSSFEVMARLLMAQYPDKVRYLAGGNWVDEGQGIYAISHVANQDLFELELAKVPEGTKTLLLHVNFDNVYAGQSDHSLNIDREQAKVLTKRGITLVLGHEHQHRTMMNDKVILVGNQTPSSVSDCLTHGEGQKDGKKYCLEIAGEDMELIPTWKFNDKVGGFAEADWQDLSGVPAEVGFVRVIGRATSAEAPSVIKAISKLRQSHKAYVITNGVQVEGVGSVDGIAESVEDIRSVNVLEMLMDQLDAEQAACVRKLLAEASQ